MIKIMPAELKHISQIMNVEKDAFIPQIQENQQVFEQRITLCPGNFLVFQDDENSAGIIGYICGEFLEKIPDSPKELQLNHIPQKNFSSTNDSNKIFYVSSFAILKNARGKGIGKMLWNESLKMFTKNNEIKKIVLLVNDEWKNARHIYEKAGFHEISVFKDFFPAENDSCSDGILMEKSLP